MQLRISGKDGPHRGASLVEVGLYGMSDLAVLMKQHTQIGEGLAALQMLTSHLPDAVMVSSTKDHNLWYTIEAQPSLMGIWRAPILYICATSAHVDNFPIGLGKAIAQF